MKINPMSRSNDRADRSFPARSSRVREDASTKRIGANVLVRLLTQVSGSVGPDELAVVQLPFSAIAWETFPAPSCGLRGADIGQVADAHFAPADSASPASSS